MYFFVRFTGAVIVIVGVVLMLMGFGVAMVGLFQNAWLVNFVNTSIFAGTNQRLVSDFRIYSAILGFGAFLVGMLAAGMGQLMLVFADVAINTREANLLLRDLRKLE
jgi:hypothetical protein